MPNPNYLYPLTSGKSGGAVRLAPLHTREIVTCRHERSIGVQITVWGLLELCECWSAPAPAVDFLYARN